MLHTDISRRGFLKGLGLCSAAVALCGVPAVAHAARSESWNKRMHDETRLLMGTIVRITVARSTRDQAEHATGLAFAEMERLIAVFDRHQAATPVSVLNCDGRLADAPAELVSLLGQAADYGRLTSHAFDITVKPVLDLMAAHANPSGSMHLDSSLLAAALALVDPAGVKIDGSRVTLARSGMGLTLDGIAKGYIVDQAACALEGQGVHHYLINAGGDVRCGGEKRPGVAWNVAVEDPHKRGAYPAVARLTNAAMATSGVYERFFDRSRTHSHLISPLTGASPLDRLSVTVMAPTTMEADVLATGLSVLPEPQALALVDRLPGRSCLIVRTDGSLVHSQAWG